MTRRLVLTLTPLVALVAAGCTPGPSAPTRRDAGSTPPPRADAGTAPPPGWDAGPPPPPVDAGPPRAADSDADGLPDEDERSRGTDPMDEDSDGDGISDGVEVLAGTDPTDAGSSISPDDFYVVLPYEDPAQTRELEFTARLGRGDIFFLVDTTGSMGAAIDNVRSSLSSTIVPAVDAAIADVVMGVGDFRDFPIDPYGSPGDWAFQVRQTMTTDTSAVQTALNSLSAGGGNDGPEATVQGLHDAVSGGSCPDGFGMACFRTGSHPIVVVVTDAEMHNGPSGANPYSGVAGARTWSEMTAALTAQEVKVVGAAVDPISIGLPFPLPNAARPHLEELTRATGSRGADGSLTVYDAPGGSVDTAVVDGIVDLVGATTQDVTSQPRDDESDSVDATRFMQSIRPVRATRATTFDETTFYGVAGGTTVTFEVTFQNDFLPQRAHVQIFQAFIDVVDTASGTVLDTRNVYVVVPALGGVLI
ncbi:MAG TPA: hypothetical protein RMH99_30480 [Sandaracinaceae bacterium LLY-WYZ-13_1]|nr:hypothetical protein [Sandaracinaceae bacterium LLY-WYZ-13_1]